MTLRSHLLALPAALAATILLSSSPSATALANDDVVLIQFLESTGADGNGTARARWRDKGDSLDFSVELEKLSAGSYDLFVAGVDRGEIAVDGTGEGEIEFETPLDPPKPLFDFEVFDQAIEIRQGGTVFFSDVFTQGGGGGGGGGSAGAKSKIEVFMATVGPDLDADGRLRYESKPGQTRFGVRVEDLAGGSYDLRVDGIVQASFSTAGFPEIELDFRDPPDDDPDDEPGEMHLPLDFDPLGALVEVVADGTVSLSGVLPGNGKGAPKKGKQAAKDIGRRKGDALQVVLHDLGVIPGAKGKVELDTTGETELEVEIEHLPAGSFALRVGGVERAIIDVVAGEGRVAFSTSPGAGELPLDFPVKGALFEVLSGEDPILATVFPTSVPDALGLAFPESSNAKRIRSDLANAGGDLDVRGRATWTVNQAGRERLLVLVRDLAAGEYTVRLDGLAVGALLVKKQDGAGRVLFDTLGKGKSQPLEVEVVGALLEVVDGEGGLLLSAVVE